MNAVSEVRYAVAISGAYMLLIEFSCYNERQITLFFEFQKGVVRIVLLQNDEYHVINAILTDNVASDVLRTLTWHYGEDPVIEQMNAFVNLYIRDVMDIRVLQQLALRLSGV